MLYSYELRRTLVWLTLHATDQCCILLNYAAPSGAKDEPHWAELHPSGRPSTLLSYPAPSLKGCTPPNYAAHCWATWHPSELSCVLLSYAALSSAVSLHSSEQSWILQCRNARLIGSQSVRYRNEKNSHGLPMPSFGFFIITEHFDLF